MDVHISVKDGAARRCGVRKGKKLEPVNKRMHGLLALVLCLAVMAVPVMGIAKSQEAVGFYYTQSGQDAYTSVREGDLLPVGATVYKDLMTPLRMSYYQYPDEEVVSMPNASALQLREAGTEGGFWLADQYDDMGETSENNATGRIMHLFKTGPKAIDTTVTVNGAEVTILGFEGINGYYASGAGSVMEAFEAYRTEHNLTQAHSACYEIDAYIPRMVDGVQVAWRVYSPNAAPQGGYTFDCPIQNTANVKVLHYWDGAVKEERYNPTTGKITVSSFSPFMVLYDISFVSPSSIADSSSVPSAPPKTGDSAHLALWFALAALSMAGMTCLAARRRKQA